MKYITYLNLITRVVLLVTGVFFNQVMTRILRDNLHAGSQQDLDEGIVAVFVFPSDWRSDYNVSEEPRAESEEDKLISTVANSVSPRSTEGVNCSRWCYCYVVDNRHYTECNADNTDDKIPKDIWNGTNVLILNNYSGRLRNSSPITRLRNLEELYAKDNGLRHIEDGLFENLPKLKVIDLSGNSFKRITPSNFSGVRLLEKLNLDDNKIRNVASGSFDHMESLQNLTLNTNENLKCLPEDVFDKNKNLSYLTLHETDLTFLRDDIFENNQILEYLTLPKNWNCNCSALWLKEWMEEEGDCPIKNFEELKCEDTNRSMIETPKDSFREKCDHHKHYLPLIGGIIVLVLVCSLVLHNRELVLVSIYTYTGYRPCVGDKRLQDEGRPFDAFIVYQSSDFSYAHNDIFKNLEPPYRICFDQRDFLPGTTYAENIIRAVECSKRTILVFSRHFVDNEYCALAFMTAHQENLRDKVNRIIVIQMEPIDESTLDRDFKVYLTRATKSKIWKDSSLFWQRLHYRMPDKPSRQPQTPRPDPESQPFTSLLVDMDSFNPHQPLLLTTEDDDDDFCILDPRYDESETCPSPEHECASLREGTLSQENTSSRRDTLRTDLGGIGLDTRSCDVNSQAETDVYTPISRSLLRWPQTQGSIDETEERLDSPLQASEESLHDDNDEPPKIEGKLKLLPLL